jgi:hypothetical protein
MRCSSTAAQRRSLPLRVASANPARPCRAEQPRHSLTVAGRVVKRSATAALLGPSAKARMICARNARRRSVLPAATQDRNFACCSLVNATSACSTQCRSWSRWLLRL